MPGEGPFLYLREGTTPHGFWKLPTGGLCLCSFVFMTRGRELLLGKYGEDPRWAELAGLDSTRLKRYGHGWTLPASHLKFGEHPRDAALRVVREQLRLGEVELVGPRVETEVGIHPDLADKGDHYDVWFFFEVELPRSADVKRPPWYADLRFVDPSKLKPSDYAREHQDVVARWRG